MNDYVQSHLSPNGIWQLTHEYSTNIALNISEIDSFSWINELYSDIIMSMMVSQITRLTVVYSTVYSGADQRKHQSSVSLALRGEFSTQRASNE